MIADIPWEPDIYLHNLVHEMPHALSTAHYEARIDTANGSTFVHARGPGFGTYKNDNEVDLLDLTEGTTDLLADDVLRTTQRTFANTEKYGPYQQSCRCVRLLIQACAEREGVRAPEMFLTFTRYYLRGDIPGLKAFIEERLGEETYQTLVALNGYPEELGRYLKTKFF